MAKAKGNNLPQKTRFIFVAGGVMSGIGKGITVSSTARILKDSGFRVSAVKIDPYLNVDAGTMNPTEHGEVFVTDDGIETDQDLGNYERFLEKDILSTNYMTQGQVYLSVIQRERALGYAGKCVEPHPHIMDEIRNRLQRAAREDLLELAAKGAIPGLRRATRRGEQEPTLEQELAQVGAFLFVEVEVAFTGDDGKGVREELGGSQLYLTEVLGRAQLRLLAQLAEETVAEAL